MIIAILGIIAGLFTGYYLVPYEIPATGTPYVAVAILVCIDSILGGAKAHFRNIFRPEIFLTGVAGNILIALVLTYTGEILGLDLYMVAILVSGMRVFNNFAILRRLLIKHVQ